MKRKIILSSFIFALILSSCNLPQAQQSEESNLVPTIVALTMQALTQSAPLATPEFTPISALTQSAPTVTHTPSATTVSGKVCYRQNSALPFKIYFQNKDTNVVSELPITSPQTEYKQALPAGTYFIYGWTTDFAFGVLANVKTFTLTNGQELKNIDVCDWAHGPFDVPYPPSYVPTATTGSIYGSVSGFPGSSSVTLRIVAFNQSTGYYYYYIPAAGDFSFGIDSLPPGTYQVVAYGEGFKGGTDKNVVVKAGETTYVTISDWGGSFPSKPGDVP